MKNILILLFLLPFYLLAQHTPTFFNYQTVLRDDQGTILKNEEKDFTLEILMNDTLVYTETYDNINTGEYGLVNFQIGSQDSISFSEIDWSLGAYALKVWINGLEIGQSDLVAVPYALYAERSGQDEDWVLENDDILSSDNKHVLIQGELEVKEDIIWNAGKDIRLQGEQDTTEFSIDFPDANGNRRWSVWAPEHKHILIVRNNGNVGVGTTNPRSNLHVIDSDISLDNEDGGILVGEIDHKNLAIDRNEIMARDGGQTSILNLQAEGGALSVHVLEDETKQFIIDDDGMVGIGTDDPLQPLHVRAHNAFAQIRLQRTGNHSGYSTIGGSSEGFVVGHFNTSGTYSKDMIVSHEGQIEANTLRLNGADIIEKINSIEPLSPGELIIIDTEHPNSAKRSQKAYDSTVLGIVSGAGSVSHGIELSQSDILDGNIPFAIAGRVYVKTIGQIKPGDLLTSSNTPGHAMAVKKHRKARGAIIGKALSTPDENGLVLVLVSLL